MTRILATLAAALALAVALTASAEAKVLVGVADQNPAMFTDPLFKPLKIKQSRVVVPWNVALNASRRRPLDRWLRAAKAAGVTRPLVHFGASNGTRCPRRPCALPKVRQFRRAFKAFRRRYRQVRDIGVWNEANHRAQPTFKHPERAAAFFNVVRKACRGCHVVAADVLDDPNMVSWLKVFKRKAHGARIYGIHNYRDTNPRRGQIFGGTARLLRTVRGQVWMTETGGIVKFVLPNRRTLFRFNEGRANKAIKRMFHLARKYRRRVKRLYIYHYFGSSRRSRFDAGLVRINKTPRPGYNTVKSTISRGAFSP